MSCIFVRLETFQTTLVCLQTQNLLCVRKQILIHLLLTLIQEYVLKLFHKDDISKRQSVINQWICLDVVPSVFKRLVNIKYTTKSHETFILYQSMLQSKNFFYNNTLGEIKGWKLH